MQSVTSKCLTIVEGEIACSLSSESKTVIQNGIRKPEGYDEIKKQA